jgi:hypothetical protein
LVEAGQAGHLGATFHATVGVKSLTGEKYAQSASLSNTCGSHAEVNDSSDDCYRDFPDFH